MQFEVQHLYHIYNRGNNKQEIFFTRDNYIYFLLKVKKYISPHCDLLAWCLMPNHFHFLIQKNNNTVKNVKEKPIVINALTEGIRLLLSSYTQGINKQNNRTGNLFQQKTKMKCISEGDVNYGYTCFRYIHQTPLKANLTKDLEGREFSSFLDYANTRNGSLCNKRLAFTLFEIQEEKFLTDSYKQLPDDLIGKIF